MSPLPILWVAAAVSVVLASVLVGSPLAGAALAAIIGLAVTFLYPSVGSICFAALAYANAPVLLGRFGGNPWIFGAATSALIAIPAFGQIFVLRRGIVIDRPFLWMIAFLGCLLLSTLGAKDYDLALAWIGTFVAEGVLLYFLMINAIRSLVVLRRVLWSLLTVAALLAALGISQEFTKDYENDFGGLAQRKLNHGLGEEQDDQGLIREREKVRAAHRASGPVNDPNHFAQILLLVFPAGVLLPRLERRPLSKGVAWVLAGLVLGGILLSYSRGGFLALVLVLGLLVPLKCIRIRDAILGLAAIAVVMLIVAPGYVDRVDTIRGLSRVQSKTAESKQGDLAVRGRLTEMLAAFNVFLDHPIFGVGPGQYTPFYSLEYMTDPDVALKQLDKERRAHSLYFELGAETGILGLSVFMTLAGVTLLRLWRLRERALSHRPDIALLAVGIALAILAYLVTSLFLSLAFQRYWWLIIALAGALVSAGNLELARGVHARSA